MALTPFYPNPAITKISNPKFSVVNAVTDETITYEFQISTTENFVNPIIDKTGIVEGTTTTEYGLTAVDAALLVTGTKYYYKWRVTYPAPAESSKWNNIGSFYYNSALDFEPDGIEFEYAPEVWALVNLTDGEDRYEIERYPYPYNITPKHIGERTRNLDGDLLVEHIATKYEIEINFGLIEQNGCNELRRFFINNASFYLISYILGNRNIWIVRPEPKYLLKLFSHGSQDLFKGQIAFEEI